MQTAALRLAVEIGLPQALVEAETKSITATELAVKTGASHLLIGEHFHHIRIQEFFMSKCEVTSSYSTLYLR